MIEFFEMGAAVLMFFWCPILGLAYLYKQYSPEYEKENAEQMVRIAIQGGWTKAQQILDETVRYRAFGALVAAKTKEEVAKIEAGILRVLDQQKGKQS
jgi:uncharacterized membrane protein